MNYPDADVADAPGEEWRQLEHEQQQYEAEQMSNFRAMYESSNKHLKGADIKGKGDVAVTIDRWEQVDFPEGPKLVIGFQGKEKTVVLNKTNYETIAEAYGDHPDGWKGKGLLLFTMKVDFNGKMVDAIRMRPSGKAAPKEAPIEIEQAPDFDDDIPF